MNKKPKIAIVLPCYNEQEIIEYTTTKLNAFIEDLIERDKIDVESFLCFVNDGSIDKTWERLVELKQGNKQITLVKLSTNFGHQAALLAGLSVSKSKCDCAITIDADLQDNYLVIEDMINKFQDGVEIVYGIRKKRESDTFFKRTTAKLFYKLMTMLGAKIIYNHADFRLLSNRAIEYLSSFKEVNIFLRGIVPTVGLSNDVVYYDRIERIAGDTKYPLKKMIAFAFEGITSFSVKPLRMVTLFGSLILLLSFFAGIYVLVSFIKGTTVEGWSSNFISIWFLGGAQLLCIGIIGEYLGKVYKETKKRPIYFIEDIID